MKDSKKFHKICILLICCLLVVAIIWLGTGLKKGKGKISMDKVFASAIVQADYPKMAQYPDESAYFDKNGEFDDDAFSAVYNAWWTDRRAQQDQPEGYTDGLDDFFQKSMQQFLIDKDVENCVYSPANLYMALCMLAEITDGESRGQILELLGADNIETLRTQASSVWNANYCDDGSVTSVLANSLWLDESLSYQKEVLDILAKNYYASSFQGEMGSKQFDKELQDWLNEQTGGLLKEQAEGIHMKEETILALASTIYFRAKWSNQFSKNATQEEIFHTKNGDISCDFMHQSNSRTYYWDDRFAAVAQSLEGSGSMWLFLPDEGISVKELLSDGKVLQLVQSPNEWKDSKYLTVNLSMPKFDVVSKQNLIEGLQALGIKDVFDFNVSDFTPIIHDMDNVYVSQAEHAARVMVDEEGCIAAAYTVMAASGTAMPPEEEVDFVLDRPFLFVITGDSGIPLFAGIVNKP